MSEELFFHIDSDPSLAKHIRLERDKARLLKKTQWWKRQLAQGHCHYCREAIPVSSLSMDHIVPLARGGKSTKGNVVPACQACNRRKKLETPVELLLRQVEHKPTQ